MAALKAVQHPDFQERDVPRRVEYDAAALDLLNHIRMVALNCRASARTDLFEACALLSTEKSAAKTAHAEALVKCLPQAIGKTPKILRPGVVEVSFDEAWLLRLVTSASANDRDSFGFLLQSRVSPWARRNVGYLAKSFAEHF